MSWQPPDTQEKALITDPQPPRKAPQDRRGGFRAGVVGEAGELSDLLPSEGQEASQCG